MVPDRRLVRRGPEALRAGDLHRLAAAGRGVGGALLQTLTLDQISDTERIQAVFSSSIHS